MSKKKAKVYYEGLARGVFDTHAHLYDRRYEEKGVRVEDLLANASSAGVDKILIPADRISTSILATDMASRYNGVNGVSLWASVGVHPHEAKDYDAKAREDLIDLLSKRDSLRIRAIGEIGLDYYYDFSPRDIQKEVFVDQIKLSYEADVPFILHERDATGDCLEILKEASKSGYLRKAPGVCHCCSMSVEAAREILKLGFYIGFDGPLTPRDPITGGQQPRVIIRGAPEFKTADTKEYTSYRGRILIPESIMYNDTSYSVTGIKYYAFVGCKELESVSIPESVRNLGYGSFAGCSGLSTVNIPSCVNEIPDALFYGCSSLGGIEIPSGVLTIGHSAFYGCSGLTEITIPAGVELIDEYAFAYCSGLKRVVIEGDPVIAETAFIGCGTELEIIKGGENDDGEWNPDANGGVKAHYSISGLRISADTPGLHIIKYRNGTVRKAVVR